MRLGIIDLGTNTCNLLIVEKNIEKGYTAFFDDKFPVKLGKGGINNQMLTKEAMERGLNSLSACVEVTQKYEVDQIFAFATSALRTAKNAGKFVRKIRKTLGIKLNIVSGEREAELIYKGIKQSVEFWDEKVLIMDIGGGSNELIIANYHEIFWKHSFPIGMARVLEKFHPEDPISPQQVKAIEEYYKTELELFIKAYNEYEPRKLIGASGAFETFLSLLLAESSIRTLPKEENNTMTQLGFGDYLALHQKLVVSTLEERKKMKGMEPMRVEMIVLASIFVKVVLDITGITNIIQTDYALKEGVMAELLSLEEKT